MTENPPIYIEPPPRRAFFVAVVSNAIALILLVLGFIYAGIAFVALALVAGLIGLFQGRSGGTRSLGGRTPGGGSPPVARG
jgi:hypothetical protein